MKIFKKIILITIFISTCFINILNATNLSIVKLSSNKDTVKNGEEIEFVISIDNLSAAFTIYLEFDNTKLDYIAGPENTNVINNRVIYVWYDKTGGSGKKGELAKFKFKAKDIGTTKVSISGEFYNGAGELIQTQFNDIQINIEENETAYVAAQEGPNLNNFDLNLENLAVENILLYPPFDTNIQEYDIEIPNNINNLNILAVPENDQSNVGIVGQTNLNEGANKIVITVTSVRGEKRDYIINGYKRNKQEEQIYLENKEKERKQLEEIYKIEELSSNNLNNEEKENVQNNSYLVIFAVIIFIGVGGIIIFKSYKK